jgi:hypothetical protein
MGRAKCPHRGVRESRGADQSCDEDGEVECHPLQSDRESAEEDGTRNDEDRNQRITVVTTTDPTLTSGGARALLRLLIQADRALSAGPSEPDSPRVAS